MFTEPPRILLLLAFSVPHLTAPVTPACIFHTGTLGDFELGLGYLCVALPCLAQTPAYLSSSCLALPCLALPGKQPAGYYSFGNLEAEDHTPIGATACDQMQLCACRRASPTFSIIGSLLESSTHQGHLRGHSLTTLKQAA